MLNLKKSGIEVKLDQIVEELKLNRDEHKAILDQLERNIAKLDGKLDCTSNNCESVDKRLGRVEERVEGHSWWLKLVGATAIGGLIASIFDKLSGRP